jgi:hypothetical protein
MTGGYVMKTLVLILAVSLLVSCKCHAGLSDGTPYKVIYVKPRTSGDVLLDKILGDMEIEEQLTAEDRLQELRDGFEQRLIEELDKCGTKCNEFTDTEVEDIDEATDVYMDDLREREQQ